MRRAYATSPLRLLTPKNHGHAAWVYTSSYGGGLVDGDDIAVEASVGSGATAFLSTQSATKGLPLAARHPGGARRRRWRGRAARRRAGRGDLFRGVPLPPDAARHRRRGRRTGSRRLDDVGPPRVGGAPVFEEYVSRTVVRLEGRLVVHDAVALRASDGSARRPLRPLRRACRRGPDWPRARGRDRTARRARAPDAGGTARRPPRRLRAGRARRRPAHRGPHGGRGRRRPTRPARLLCPGSSATARGRGRW